MLRVVPSAVRFAIGALVLISLIRAPSALAQGISIGSGGKLDLGSAKIDLGCTPFQVAAGGSATLDSGQIVGGTDVGNAGQLDAGSATVQASGDWSNNGTFLAGTSLVALQDGCGRPSSTLSGDSSFFRFTDNTTSGRTLVFTAGRTQRVSSALTLAGTTGNRLHIRSSSPGSPGFLELASTGTQSIAEVDVQDNHELVTGQVIAPGPPVAFNSVDSGGNSRWFLDNGQVERVAEVPTLSGAGAVLLACALFAAYCWTQRA